MSFTIGSLFDGSGGFPLAAFMCGGVPLWAAEVEPYPIAVTKSRFPYMKHLGDVTQIKGNEIEPVDVLSFGFPCQDVSIAGGRKGVRHEENGDEETTRSGLFHEAVRIIKEMRDATNGLYPTFAVFENVPGLLSSSRGADFRIVLEELIKIVEPDAVMPPIPKNGWPYADCYCGDGWSFAYRIFDSQYIRTAQRRKRIYAVIDFRGQRALSVLAQREGLRGYSSQSRATGEGTPHDAQRGVVSADSARDSLAFDARGNGDGHTASTITGDHENRVTDYTTIVLDRAFYNCGENAQFDPRIYEDGTVPTVVARGPSAVAYGIGNGQANQSFSEEVVGALNCMHDQQAVAVPSDPYYIVRRLTPTECARLQGFPDGWGHPDKKTELTEEEYHFWLNVRQIHDRINGRQAKDYTEKQILSWYNKLHTDSSEYKMWGNGIALPCALYVMQGIEDAMK